MQCEHADGLDVFAKWCRRKNARSERFQPRAFTLRIPVLCVLGFSLYLGWIFCLFWSPALFPLGTLDDLGIHVVRMAMTVAMFLAYVTFGCFARFFASRKGETVLRAVTLVGCPCGCMVGLFPLGLDVAWCFALWVASGIGSSALLLVWSKKVVDLTRKQVIFTSSSAFLAGSFFFVATAFMPTSIAFLFISLLPVASVAVACLDLSPALSFAYDEQCVSGDSSERGVATESLERNDGHADGAVSFACRESKTGIGDAGEPQRITFMRTVLLAFAYSIGIGFAGSCATVQVYYPWSVYVIAVGNACAAVFTVLFLVRRSRNVSAVLIEVFLPVMLVCMFVFSFASHGGQLACIMVMLALLACHDIVDIASVSKSSRLFGENYVKTFAVGRTLNGLGCSLGWAVGMSLNFLPGIDGAGRLFVCFALVVFLVIVTSFAVFHPGPLSYVHDLHCEAVRAPQGSSVATCGATDGLEAKVGSVARRYGLTSRQEEVLLSLAQGRNASHIAQRFTISTHTAKSHIYNIYNKLGVHSQQELLDIVDAEGVATSVQDETSRQIPVEGA